MDWFNTWFNPIVTLFALLVLAGFTVVLAIATIKLHRSTKRYAGISKELLKMEELKYLRNLYEGVRGLSEFKSAEMEAVLETPKGVTLSLETQTQFHNQWIRFYKGLVGQMLERIALEFPQGDTE